MTKRPSKKDTASFAKFETIKVLVPGIDDYIAKTIRNPQEQENYVVDCIKLANDWLNNQLEAAEVNTFAKSNEKKLIESNYATYLILRGLVRGERAEQNSWVKGFQDDAKDTLADIIKRKAAAPGHSSRTETFSKKRWMLKKSVKQGGRLI